MKEIITVGISPCWDIVCLGEGLDWGCHSVVSQERFVAGKAFNVSRGLAWMEVESVAAGLWGADDFEEMSAAVKSLEEFIDVRFTKSRGKTRENITVIDRSGGCEMHLRAACSLASKESLENLKDDLGRIVMADSVCVFAGSMPGGELLDDVVSIIGSVRDAGARVVVDTSGDALRQIVGIGAIDMIKPNMDELCELTGVRVEDDIESIAEVGRSLLGRVKTVVVSRGDNGAVVINSNGVLAGRCVCEKPAVSTVGCGDYLLAGFLCGDGLKDSLIKGLKAGAVRACGISESSDWNSIENQIEVKIESV